MPIPHANLAWPSHMPIPSAFGFAYLAFLLRLQTHLQTRAPATIWGHSTGLNRAEMVIPGCCARMETGLHLIELGQEGWRARAAYFFTCNICIHSYIVVDAYIHVFTYLYVYTCIHVHICTYIFICTDFHMPVSTMNSVYLGGYICIDIFAFIYL